MTKVSINGTELDDGGFNGTNADSLPSVTADFSCKSQSAPANPDTVVDIRTEAGWIRIPIIGIEQWVNKDGPADINRTSKVRFPLEWGSQSIVSVLSGFEGQDGSDTNPTYDLARVAFYDELAGEWIITQLGYVGGIGPHNRGSGKFWIYDPADLLKGQSIAKTWSEANLAEAIEFPISGTDARGESVGIQNNIFDVSVTSKIYGIERDTAVTTTTGSDEYLEESPLGGFFNTIGIDSEIENLYAWMDTIFGEPTIDVQKRFQANRHTMVDHLNWLCERIDGRWWFEPKPDGLILVIDVGRASHTYSREYFADNNVLEPDADTNYNDVNVLNNSALIDIKPFNTLYVNGESALHYERYGDGPVEVGGGGVVTDFLESASTGAASEKYPSVKVSYQPLLERANGEEFTTQHIESDAITLEAVENEAVKKLRNHIAEQTEGSMEIQGAPTLNPYDYLIAKPVCDDTFTNVSSQPLTWEVNGIKHIRNAGERYTTEIGTSIAFDDSQVTVEEKTYKQA